MTISTNKQMISKKHIDLRKVLSKYKNKWVALKPNSNEVVTSAKSLAVLLNKSEKKGVKKPYILKAKPIHHLFAG